jgi:hypothetical protein
LFRQYLSVLDIRSLEPIADIPAASPRSVADGVLVYGGSAGQVSVLSASCSDCGGLWVFSFDLP